MWAMIDYIAIKNGFWQVLFLRENITYRACLKESELKRIPQVLRSYVTEKKKVSLTKSFN